MNLVYMYLITCVYWQKACEHNRHNTPSTDFVNIHVNADVATVLPDTLCKQELKCYGT